MGGVGSIRRGVVGRGRGVRRDNGGHCGPGKGFTIIGGEGARDVGQGGLYHHCTGVGNWGLYRGRGQPTFCFFGQVLSCEVVTRGRHVRRGAFLVNGGRGERCQGKSVGTSYATNARDFFGRTRGNSRRR